MKHSQFAYMCTCKECKRMYRAEIWNCVGWIAALLILLFIVYPMVVR